MKKNSIFNNSNRLTRRLTLYVVLASTFIAIFTSAFQLYETYKTQISGIELRLNEIRDSYSDNIASRVWVANQQELERSLQGILRLPDIEYIEIYEDSELIAEQGRLPEANTIERVFPLSYTFHGEKQQIGRVHIVASLAGTYAYIVDQAIVIIASNAIKTFLVSGFMLLLFYQLVAKHLHRIARYAKNVSARNLDRRLVLDRSGNDSQHQDEFDVLVDAVQVMQLNLATSISQLAKSEKNILLTLNSIGDAVITTDADGYITRMNQVAEDLTGWSFQEADGIASEKIFSIINASTHEPIENPVKKVLATGEMVHLSDHAALIAKDGAKYQIADSAAPIFDDDDRILGVVLVFSDITEAYRLRENATALQLQFQRLFDDMQTMIVITTADGTVKFANNTPLKVVGIELDDVLEKKVWNCAWFAYDASVQAIVKRDCAEVQAGQNILQDIQIATPNGLLWIAYSIHPVINEDGKIIQLLHEGRDISVRKAIENDIRASAQQLKLYREQAPLATIEWNTDFQVVDWNAAAEDLFGYTLDEVKGRNFVDIMLPESAMVDVKQIWEDLISQTGGTKSTNENITKNGSVILCEWHNTTLKDESGTVIGAASLVLDITAQYKAQQGLLRKEQEQREILDTLVDAVITIDETGNMLTFNKTAETLFGYSSEEIIGQNVSRLMPEPYVSKHDGYLQRYLKTGDAHIIGFGREVMGLHKNQQTFPMHLSIAELHLAVKGKRRFIGSCHDLTLIKQQEEQLRRSQKMDALGKLTGGIAHDYNNMLGVVIGYAEMLESELNGQTELASYAHEIRHAGLRGAKLTKKLMAFTREKDADAESVDIGALLEDEQDMLEKTLTARVQLVFDLANDLWPVWLDIGDLEDAIVNLSINAMHAMKEGGQLTLQTRNAQLSALDARQLTLMSGEYVTLSITDTGCGMDEETTEKIFDPFYSTKGEGGTGLGLSQVYGFVERSNGVIKVYSELGQGARFVLYFPRHHGRDDDGETANKQVITDLTGTETILAVDDEPALLNLTSELLGLQGYRVLQAESGEQALEILKTESIDLLLSDVVMPGIDGYQLAAKVRAQYPAIKIQLVSGFTDERNVELVDRVLQQQLIQKPYNSETLLQKVRELLNSGDE